MLAYCGPACYARDARSQSVQGVPLGHPCDARVAPASAAFCDRFPYIGPRYARETIAEICSMGASCCARDARSHSVQGVPSGHPCDARVAPLATAIISQTGS